MGRSEKKVIGVLTSSRADFGIYLPLLKRIRKEPHFKLELIVFGTHLSKFHGFTIKEIEVHGFRESHRVSSLLVTDDPTSVSSSFAITALKFAEFWGEKRKRFDMVICLGDRYEMAAAVMASIPFNVPVAHLHAGETTLGAIDNKYRDIITLTSSIQFVAEESLRERVRGLLGSRANCFVVGALSLDNLKEFTFEAPEVLEKEWGIDTTVPFLLVTVHPETVDYKTNGGHSKEITRALRVLLKEYNVVLTMPNADTMGTVYRESFRHLSRKYHGRVHLHESLGTRLYFSCLRYCALVVGNSSSGIIEAASFGKYAINLGDRQKGRLAGPNVINSSFDHRAIVSKVQDHAGKTFQGVNIYYKGGAASKVLKVLQKELENA